MLPSFDYNTHVECLLPPKLWFDTLLSSKRYSQFERFHPQHIQMVNKTPSFKTKSIGNNAGVCRVPVFHV